MEQQDGEQASEYDMPQEDKEKMPEKYGAVSLDDFVEYSKSMFEYWTEDDFASSFRKMLTIEQFRSEEMQNLYQQYLVSGPAEYVKDLFKNMEIKNPEEEAVKFYANMFFYYSVYDGATDKTKAKCQFEYMLDKIVEGKLNAYYDSACLVRQKFIRDDSLSIQSLVDKRSKESGKPLKLVSFLRWSVGGN